MICGVLDRPAKARTEKRGRMRGVLNTGGLFRGTIGIRLLQHFVANGYSKEQAMEAILGYLFPGDDAPKTGAEALSKVSQVKDSKAFAARFVSLVVNTLPDGEKLIGDMIDARKSYPQA